MEEIMQEFLKEFGDKDKEYNLSSFEKFLESLNLSIQENKYLIKCKYLQLDINNLNKMGEESFLLTFLYNLTHLATLEDYMDIRYFKTRAILIDYYFPEFVDKYMKSLAKNYVEKELEKLKIEKQLAKKKYNETSGHQDWMNYIYSCDRYNNAMNIGRYNWNKAFDVIRELTNTIKENEIRTYQVVDFEAYDEFLAQPNIKEFFDEIRPENELILDSMELLLESIGKDKSIESFLTKCKKCENTKTYSTTSRLFSWYANAFVNNQTRNTHLNKYKMDNRQRIVTLLIMDYYNPNYIDQYLIPYLYLHKDGDIKRAFASKTKTEMFYTDIDNPIHVKQRLKAEESYNNICNIYNTDWKKNFATIKQINAEIRKNEERNLVVPTSN